MRKRLNAFEVDGIEDSGMIEYLTRKKKEGDFRFIRQRNARTGQLRQFWKDVWYC